MTVFAIVAVILDRELQECAVFSIGRADCEAIIRRVVGDTAGAHQRKPHGTAQCRNDRAGARLPMTNSPRKLSAERPGAAALAVAHALALLHARQDHAAELVRRAELEATANDPRSHLRPLLVRSAER